FKTTSNAGLRHESNKSLAIRKRRFFRPTAQGSSFFNPSETRRVLTWLQSVFGARDRPGSLTASRRTTDGIPLHNEHISGTHNSILLSRSHKWSSRGYEKRAYRESFTPCSGEWPSANHSNYDTVPGQSKRFFPRADCDYALDRKSTRLNSSHVAISYAVFCLKKKKKKIV